MPTNELSLNSATASNMSNRVSNVTIPTKQVDGVLDQEETTWQNMKWSQQWGYFNAVPELKSAIIMKAIWNVGKGYQCDPETTVILDHISGWGKDTFDDILFNLEIVKRIGGDAYAEIIRDADSGILINLKPLNPGDVRIIIDRKGIIKRYEYVNIGKIIKLEPKDVLHLSNNRLANQIHGISDIDAVEQIILADNESFVDTKTIMHHQARPMIVFKLGTDDQAKIDSFAKKMDAAVNKGENIYVPDDVNSFSFEVVQVTLSQMVLEWRNDLRNKFYRTIGLPQVIFGQGNATESGGKIEYLAHEQVFEKDQRYLEKQIWNQLQLKINLLPPTSLLENLQTDQSKDAGQGMNMQASEMTAGQAG